ncbi:hypothetical protein B0H12DRAFT_1102754 [Mycena haematopus]|nr:hypothetical protein B0H12DRAFT_1102754 [Mycena haematopus]
MPRLKSVWVGLCFSGVATLGLLWFLLPWRAPAAHWAIVPAEGLALAEELGHPAFTDIKIYEQNLPQLETLSRVTGRPRYLFFPWASWGSGWNNIFQEQLLNTHLSYLSERAYVFPQYIPRDHPPFPDTLPNGTRYMLNIPMNAFVSGPTGGGPLSADGTDPLARRAIPAEGWDVVCPHAQVVVLNVHDTMRELEIDGSSEGEEIMTRWAAKLLAMTASCVSIEGGSVFDYMFTGSSRVLSIWPTYGDAPTLKYFAWSPLITAALFRNAHLFSPSSSPPAYLAPTSPPPYTFQSFHPLHTSEPPISGTLGIHVRRGDYENHCVFLADYGSSYNAWNALGTPGLNASYPALPDYFDVPKGVSPHDAALAHCWPSADAIVDRARRVREGAQDLRRIYISTNGDRAWVGNLTALLAADGWEAASSHDMELTKEEQAVGQAVDMAVLTAAESFIGVGFSSLSSNVVQIRLAGGREAGSIHFW